MGFDFGKELVARTKDRVFKKVIGGVGDFIRGIPGIGRSDDLIGDRLKRRTDHYSFPLDVEQDPGLGNQGHYILFYINELENAQLSFGELSKSGASSVLEEQGKRKLPNYVREIVGNRGVQAYEKKFVKGVITEEQLIKDLDKQSLEIDFDENEDYFDREDFIKTKLNMGYLKQAGDYRGMNVKRAPTKRLKTAISMYMPPGIEVTYGAGYKDQEIGTLAENALTAYSQFTEGNYGASADAIVNMDDGVQKLLAGMLTTAIGVLPGMTGIKELYEMRVGKVFSNRMEVAFTGLEKRKFNYTFKMTPRSQKEAEEIRAIIFAFKANMLPELDGDYEKGRRMIVPNTFDIKYMYQGDENQYLNKISTCVLESFNVKYGGAQFQAFAGNDQGAPMVETEITLGFKEMETITRERIFEGF